MTHAWLNEIRNQAQTRFEQLGFPTPKHEDWKHTNLRSLATTDFQNPPKVDISPEAIQRLTTGVRFKAVFINGRFSDQLSDLKELPEGVRVENLATALEKNSDLLKRHFARYAQIKDQAFVALNTAQAADGVFIHLPRDVHLDEPIYMIFLSSGANHPATTQIRNLILTEPGSRLRWVESFFGLDGGIYFNNIVTECLIGENASCEHFRIQRENLATYHFGNLSVSQRKNSRFSLHSVSLGASLARHETEIQLSEEGASCFLTGLYAGSGNQQVDNKIQVEHVKPNCASSQYFKGILDGKAQGGFNGRVIVRQDAQKADAKQTNKNLLLSSEAVANTKPQLEIYADDVKCSHGATVSQIDEQVLFYLRSRGIGPEQAQKIIAAGFVQEILDLLTIPSIQNQIAAAWADQNFFEIPWRLE